jgi:peptidyl-prolyl cis-trans isomerase D
MLNSFRNLLSGKTLYVIVGVCALPFIFTGVSSFNTLFSNYGTVNGIEVTQLDVNNATIRVEERYKSIFGENFSIDQLEEQELLNLIKSQITNQKIIEAMAFDNNLGISMDDVKRAIIKEETFLDENGKFDQSIFEAAVRGAGMIPDEYLQFVLTSITAKNLINSISESTFILNEDLIDFTAFAEATKDIIFIKSDRDEIISLQGSSDEEAKEFYEANQLLFLSDEKREFNYAFNSLESFSKNLEIDNELIENAYLEYLSEIQMSNQNRISHIMFTKSNDDAVKIAQDVYKNLINGDIDFTEAVKRYSDDEASIEAAGDLGYSSGDAFPEEFEDAINELSLNQISTPIDLGETIHIIKVTEILKSEAESKKSFAETLSQEFIDEEAGLLMGQAMIDAEELVLSGRNFNSIIDTLQLKAESTQAIAESEFSDSIMADARPFFDTEFVEGDIEVIEVEDGFYVIGLNAIEPPKVISFKDSRQKAINEVRAQKADELIAEMQLSAFARLAGENQMDLPNGFEKESFQKVTRYSSLLPREIIDALFKLNPGDTFTETASDNNRYWVSVTEAGILSEKEIAQKVEGYRDVVLQYANQQNAILIDQKLKEDVKVNLRNLDPQI